MSSSPIVSGTDKTQIASICAKHDITEEQFAELRKGSVKAKSVAYCPYSRFNVGAMLLGSDGSFTSGVNVENASYPVGTCAERVAIGKAVSEGITSFRAIAVATDISPPASPCGMCRQFIREFCSLEVPIIMFDKNEDFVVHTLDELLPMSFGPEKLPPRES